MSGDGVGDGDCMGNVGVVGSVDGGGSGGWWIRDWCVRRIEGGNVVGASGNGGGDGDCMGGDIGGVDGRIGCSCLGSGGVCGVSSGGANE